MDSIKIKINFLKMILEHDINISEYKILIEDYNKLLKIYTSMYVKAYVEKHFKRKSVFKKFRKKNELDLFLEKHESLLKIIFFDCCYDAAFYYFMLTNIVIFEAFMEEIKNSSKEILEKFYRQLLALELNEFEYTTHDLTGVHHFRIIYNIDARMFENMLTDGNMFFFGQCNQEMHDVYIENAKYILHVKNGSHFLDKLILTTLDVNLPQKAEYLKAKTEFPKYNEDKDLYNRTLYMQHLFNLNLLINIMSEKKVSFYLSLNRITDNSELLDENISILERQIQELRTQKKKLYNMHEEYGLSDFLLKENVKLFQENCAGKN